MLKLERTAYSQNITVRVRNREPFFNTILFKAFAMAAILHFGALLAFKVHLIHRDRTTWIKPIPRIVETDLDSTHTTTAEHQNRVSTGSIPPAPSTPQWTHPPVVIMEKSFLLETNLMSIPVPHKPEERLKYNLNRDLK